MKFALLVLGPKNTPVRNMQLVPELDARDHLTLNTPHARPRFPPRAHHSRVTSHMLCVLLHERLTLSQRHNPVLCYGAVLIVITASLPVCESVSNGPIVSNRVHYLQHKI